MTNQGEHHLDCLVLLKAVQPVAPLAPLSWQIITIQPANTLLKEDAPDLILKARLTLYPPDREAYEYNLACPEPSLFLILRTSDNEGAPHLHSLTASPFEAQDYQDGEGEIIERWQLEGEIKTWLEDFMQTHAEQEPFKKRKRGPRTEEKQQFGKTPIFLDNKDRLKL